MESSGDYNNWIRDRVAEYAPFPPQPYANPTITTTGSGTFFQGRKKVAKKPNMESLKKRKIGERDEIWLAKIFTKRDLSNIPLTVFLKLWAKGLIDVNLTEEGKKQGVIAALFHLGNKKI